MAIVSFRLGGTDGVSVEAAKWAGAFAALGFRITTVAGEGPVDHLIPSLAIDGTGNATRETAALRAALAGADLVVVENVLSLPLRPDVSAALAQILSGRRAIIHHHDLPWERARYMGGPLDKAPQDDAHWAHVTISENAGASLADRGIEATTIPNLFDPNPTPGDRFSTRERLAIRPDEVLLVQPTRAIARKGIPDALVLARAFGATYWLLGPAEEGYGPTLDRLLDEHQGRVLRGGVQDVADAYAAADAVCFPSTWEGFGNPAIESALHGRPLAIGPYPVGRELAARGFLWFPSDDAGPLATFLAAPDPHLIAHNRAVARRHFDLGSLPARLQPILTRLGFEV